jgi:DNA-binding MarR family transcriptional regulator
MDISINGYRPMKTKTARTVLLLRVLQMKAYSRIAESLMELAMTPAQYMVLSIASHHGTWSTAAMARRFMVSPQSMNETIATLEAKKLITRRESPEHRRTLHISLTLAGVRLLAKCDARIDRVEEEVFGYLSAAELERFRDMLGRGVVDSSIEDIQARDKRSSA